jgi:hypothetical protein
MDPNLMGLIIVALVVLAVIFLFRRNEPAVPAQPPTVQPLTPAQPVIILAQPPVAHVASPVLSIRNVNNMPNTGVSMDEALANGCEFVEYITPGSYTRYIKQPKFHPPVNTFIDNRVNHTQAANGNQGQGQQGQNQGQQGNNQNRRNDQGQGQQGQNQGNNRNQNQPNNGGNGGNQNQPNNGGGGNQGNRRGNGN